MWSQQVLIVFAIGTLAASVGPLAVARQNPVPLSREQVRKVQRTLTDRGYDLGGVDGVLGRRTRYAIRQYQRSVNLPLTGRLDAVTAGKLGVESEFVAGRAAAPSQENDQRVSEAARTMKRWKTGLDVISERAREPNSWLP